MRTSGSTTGLITACLALAGGACGGGGALPDDASPAARAALERCSALDASARQDCYQEHVLAVLATDGVRPALDMLASVAAGDVNAMLVRIAGFPDI